MGHDPISGPIPREQFRELVNAPAGEATKVIRKFDPMFGRRPGEKIKWRVTFIREVEEEGEAIIEATSEKEAEQIADKLGDSEISWDDPPDTVGLSEIVKIEPMP